MSTESVTFLLFENHPDPMLIYDIENLRILAANDAALQRYGYTEAEFLAMSIIDIRPPEDVPALLNNLRPEVRLNRAGIWRHLTRSGELIHVDIITHSLEYRGRPAKLSIARDVTSLVKSKQQLEEQTASLRAAQDLLGLGIWKMDLDNNTLSWSDNVYSMYGISAEDFGHSLDDYVALVHPEDREAMLGGFQDFIAAPGPTFHFRHRIIRQDGRIIHVRGIGEYSKTEQQNTLTGVVQDVTELIEMRERLEGLSRRLVNTLESISDGFFTLDRDWRFTFVNARAESMMQQKRENLLGRSIWEVYPDAADSSYRSNYEKAVSSRETIHFIEFAPPSKCWYQFTASPADDGLAISFRDITEQKKIEDHLRQSQKLEAIGQLTGGVAHDFNNLLTVILGNSEILAENLNDPDMRQLAQMAATAARRGASLTSRLLAFARRQPLQPKPTNANQLIESMDGLLRRSMPENIKIEILRDEKLWLTAVDPVQLETSLLNLVLNARDAMPEGGCLTIETRNTRLDEDYARDHTEVKAGDYIMVSVSDTGTGMTPEVMAQAFDPFFTTKQSGKGSGLGLSMTYGFVKQSGGHAKIYSEVGEGSTIKLYFQRICSNEEGQSESGRQGHALLGNNEHILVVEDDPLVLEHVNTLLQKLAYRVSTATGGGEALQILQEKDDIVLLFTDVVMAGDFNGRELADAALRLKPALKVLFTSGYTDNAIVHHGKLDPGVKLLSKPYQRVELAEKIREVLDQ